MPTFLPYPPQALEDMTTWWPKIRPGGIMAGHDFRAAFEVQPEQDWYAQLCQRCLAIELLCVRVFSALLAGRLLVQEE
jgi:hypothetical protein